MEQKNWMRSGHCLWALAMVSFMICAACRLTFSPPQNTLGQESEVTATSMPTRSMFLMRSSQSNISGTGVMKGAPSRWIARRPPYTAFMVYLPPCFSSSLTQALSSMWVWTSITVLMAFLR